MKYKADSKDLDIILKCVFPSELKKENIILACIGTDRSTGDSFGPLVGTELEKLGFDVIGTLKRPLHANNLEERLAVELNKNKTVIAIDACLGKPKSVGKYLVGKESIKPGAGVGKRIPEVGDYSISGVVNIAGYMSGTILSNTRLSFVMEMASTLANELNNLFTNTYIFKKAL